MGSDKNEITPPKGFVLDENPPEGFIIDGGAGPPPNAGADESTSLFSQLVSLLKQAGGALPQIGRDVARGTVENLPIIGATTAAGLSAVPSLAAGPFAPAVMVGAGGAGGLTGEWLKQFLGPLVGLTPPGSPEEASNARAGSAMDMMMGEMGGQGATSLISKLLAPFASRMTPEATAVLNQSREMGVPIAPSAINRSLIARGLEGTAEGTITGKPMMNSQRQKAVVAINKEIGRIQGEVGKAGETEIVGQGVKEALGGEGGAVENFWAKSKGLYDDFYKAANVGSTPSVNTNPLREKLHEILGPELKLPKAQQDEKLIGFIQDVLENQPAQMAPKELHEIQKRLYDIGISNRGQVKAIKESIDKAWDEFGGQVQSDVIGALNKARTQFKEGMTELVESPLVKKLIKDESLPGSVQPGAVISTIYRPGNEKVIANLSKYLPEKTVEDMNARYLANFFDERSPVGRGIVKSVGMDKYIDGEALYKAVGAHKSILESAFDAKTVRALQNLALLSKASMQDMKALQNRSLGDVSKVLNWVGILGGGSAISTGNIGPAMGVVAGAAAAPGIARSLMAPNGILKTWLTEGLMRGPTGMMIRGGVKEGLKMGGRAIALGSGQTAETP